MEEKSKKIINALGGTSKVAMFCGVSKGAVSQWKTRGIPNAHLNFLNTKFKKELKPIYEGVNHE